MVLGCRRALMCGAAVLLLPASAFGQTTQSGTSDPVPPASDQQSGSTTAAPTDEPAAQTSTSSDNGASSGDATSRTDISGQISEIVVTAQRRSENLQRVPISAEVVGAPALAQQNLTSLNDIGSVKPSIRVSNGLRSNAIYVRGTGSGDSQSFDQSVGTFIDDIYHGRSRGSAATFLDLDHVEILKGPQTTYFGNNAIAGRLQHRHQKAGQGPRRLGARADLDRHGHEWWPVRARRRGHDPAQRHLRGARRGNLQRPRRLALRYQFPRQPA